MKRLVSIVLLFIFLFQCGIKTGILLNFYIRQDYITQTFCVNKVRLITHCNGKCYLQKQLITEEKRERNLPEAFKVKTELSPVIQTSSSPQIFKEQSNNPQSLELTFALPEGQPSSVFHPPTRKA